MLPKDAFLDTHLFEAKLGMMNITKDGLWRIPLLVLPDDVPKWLFAAIPGQHIAVGVQAFSHSGHLPDKKKADAMVSRAALLCKEDSFQKFMEHIAAKKGISTTGEDTPENRCAILLRLVLGVYSRSELSHNADAREQFVKVCDYFEKWSHKND